MIQRRRWPTNPNLKPNFKLRELRIAMGVSAAEVSRELGVSGNLFSFYESGYRTPSDDMKVKIAKFFGVTVGWLFFDEENTESAEENTNSPA